MTTKAVEIKDKETKAPTEEPTSQIEAKDLISKLKDLCECIEFFIEEQQLESLELNSEILAVERAVEKAPKELYNKSKEIYKGIKENQREIAEILSIIKEIAQAWGLNEREIEAKGPWNLVNQDPKNLPADLSYEELHKFIKQKKGSQKKEKNSKMNSNHRGRGRGFPNARSQRSEARKINKGKKNECVEYKLGRGDSWVGDYTLEEDFVAWALIDNVHQKNPSFNKISNVETRIIELEQIIKFVKSDVNKSAIDKLIKKWQLRVKELLIEEQSKKGNELIIVEDEQLKTAFNEKLKEAEVDDQAMEIINLTDDSENNGDTPKSDNKRQNNGSDKLRGIAIITQNEEKIENNNKKTMADIIKESINLKQTEIPNQKNVRLRVSLKCKMTAMNQEGLSREVRRIIKRALEIIKQFESNAMICPWNMNTKALVTPITYNDVDKLTYNEIREYLHLPNGTSSLIRDQMCHGIGINVKTEQEIQVFINKWNSIKYRSNDDKIRKDWMSVRRSEVQKNHRAIPVGFFQGSSENGVYELLNQELPKILDMDIEVSFQNIYQRGITGQFWENAKLEAKKQGSEKSREFRRTKFNLAPSGLIAYVYKESDVSLALKKLMDKYGKQTEEKAWPQLPDGSRMKFIPLLNKTVRNTKVKNQLSKRIHWHITAKALEEVMDLPVMDIFENKEYFNGKSLLYILQGEMSKEKHGATIFRHVVRKWSNDPESKEYQITAHYHMRTEATKFLKNIRQFLSDNYGEASLQHLGQKQRKSDNFEEIVTDNDAIHYILGMDNEDNNEGILEEGFKLVLEKNHDACPTDDSTIHVSDASKETLDSDESMRSRLSMSSYSNNSRSSNGSQVQWDPSVQDKETQKKRKMSTALNDLEMTLEEVDEWKHKNKEAVATIDSLHTDNYKRFKAVVKVIRNQ